MQFNGFKTLITIQEVADKGTQIKVKGLGQDGVHTYSIWKNKQSGEETQAYSLLKNKSIGEQVELGWEIYNGQRPDGSSYQSRSVKFVSQGNQQYNPQQNFQPKQNFQSQPNFRQSMPKNIGRNFEEEARGKCKFGFLIELMKLGKTLEEAEPIAEEWTEASMRKLPKNQQIYNQYEEGDNEEIPFSEIPF